MGTLGTVLSLAGSIVALVFAIQILIHAFKRSVGWGLASLFVPFVIFVWSAKNWAELKRPTLLLLAGIGLSFLGTGLTIFGAVSSIQG